VTHASHPDFGKTHRNWLAVDFPNHPQQFLIAAIELSSLNLFPPTVEFVHIAIRSGFSTHHLWKTKAAQVLTRLGNQNADLTGAIAHGRFQNVRASLCTLAPRDWTCRNATLLALGKVQPLKDAAEAENRLSIVSICTTNSETHDHMDHPP
jgi:hypothetical protein